MPCRWVSLCLPISSKHLGFGDCLEPLHVFLRRYLEGPKKNDPHKGIGETKSYTPLKSNINTKNNHIWKEIHFPNHKFWVSMLDFGGVGLSSHDFLWSSCRVAMFSCYRIFPKKTRLKTETNCLIMSLKRTSASRTDYSLKNSGWIRHVTPMKINMEPKNGGLEDDFPFQTGDFQVPC